MSKKKTNKLNIINLIGGNPKMAILGINADIIWAYLTPDNKKDLAMLQDKAKLNKLELKYFFASEKQIATFASQMRQVYAEQEGFFAIKDFSTLNQHFLKGTPIKELINKGVLTD
jgi:hypothetical protein|nr:MAG TPA: hypothetical protein [Caudoviricetes sp.]